MYRLIVFSYLLAIVFGGQIPTSHSNHRPYFPSDKIVGGVKTPIEDVPYQVAIEVNGHQFCGGSIITTKHILSAGHCIRHCSTNASGYTVRTGSSKLQSGGTVIQIKSCKSHPKFDGEKSVDYDVSVIELEEDIQVNSRSAIITLAKTEAVSGNALVAGWGEGPLTRKWLYSVIVPIVSRTACEKAYDKHITARMICAGEVGRNVCHGDSGGPLVAVEGDMRTQVGIASWGHTCTNYDYPGVFTNINDPEIRFFIKKQAGV